MRSRGFSIIELLLALILASILGAIVTKTLVSTSHFYARDSGRRSARAVARSAAGLLESELRMVESSSGIVSADSMRVVVRVPYALGILCTTGGATAMVSLLPMDSLAYASAGFSGFAVRDAAGAYTVNEAGVTLGAGTPATCTPASVTTLTGGLVVALSPAPAATFAAGSAVLLFQRVTYRFATSTALPGRLALWRDVSATGVSEELAAPFDASARFRFYVLSADTSQPNPPASLANVRGLDLVLNGASETTSFGKATPELQRLTTAAFFRNRLN